VYARCTCNHFDICPGLVQQGRRLERTLPSTDDKQALAGEALEIAMLG
jgi:hypothetical protein